MSLVLRVLTDSALSACTPLRVFLSPLGRPLNSRCERGAWLDQLAKFAKGKCRRICRASQAWSIISRAGSATVSGMPLGGHSEMLTCL
ncbi:hypothetical protein MHYP_G00039420 [Metynnis hypsauchen]